MTQLFGKNIKIECRVLLFFNNKVVNVTSIVGIHLSIQ